MSTSITQRIEKQLQTLSRSETRVGSWIIANTHRAAEVSISELAKTVEVSEPTVIRFCRSLGLAGFRDLRNHLIADQHRPESYLQHNVASDDDTTDATIKVLESAIRALVEIREFIVDMPFDAAVGAMQNARQIIFAGLGASGHVARDASHKFFRLGIPCPTALDTQMILQQAAIAKPGDVFVAISHTGHWPELVQGMQIAVDAGATVIAITDPHSPLAAAASIVFACHADEDTNVFTPMSSRLAQLTLLDAIQVALALRMGDAAQTNLHNTKLALSLAGKPQSNHNGSSHE